MDEQSQNQSQETVNQGTDQNLSDADLRERAIAAAEAIDQTQQPPVTETPPLTDASQEGGLSTKKLALQVARLEKQLRDQKANHDKTQQDYENLVNRLKDPEQQYALLEENGGTYQDWTNRIVSGSKPQRDQRDIELDHIKQSLQQLQTQLETKQQEEQHRSQQASMGEAQQYANKYLEDNKDKCPVLHAMKRGNVLVREAVRRHNEGVVFDDDELAAEMEKEAVETLKQEIKTLTELDVINQYLSELGYKRTTQNLSEKELAQRDISQGRKTNQTLTNDLSGTPSSSFDYFGVSDDELRQRGIKLAEQAAAEQRRNT